MAKHRDHIAGLLAHNSLNVSRPCLKRCFLLGCEAVPLINADDAAKAATDMIQAAFIRKARVKNTGRAPKRNDAGHTPLREIQADAYEEYWRLQPVVGDDEALCRTATKEVPQNVLVTIVKRGVKPVNDILRKRGTM